ncbi:E3 ubiquitin-protein ligase UPL1 isoform X2 [Musa acuminata AAA Group]|uniref:E3 ubiquitin-protein ligase UPL1 isoform X2 n=1 Tax=Musa acuminata AAA Group TaxID=214697 RepID=UPI0031D8E30A
MKFKKRRVLEVLLLPLQPSHITFFINNVISAAFENIEELLKDFRWEFDKGDFHHWIDLFNHFDSFFEKHIKPRKDLQFEDNFLNADPLFPRDAVLHILRVMRVILDNCTNKHFYSSFEHLSLLLASTDADIVEATLQTLAAFLKKTVGKCYIRDASLRLKLFALSQGWGGKEDGLGLVACSLPNGCDSVAYDIGSTLHFEFYSVGESSKNSHTTEYVNQGWQVIHLPSISNDNEDVLQIMQKLVRSYNIPSNLCFSLSTRLRFAKAFGSLTARRQFIRIRLYAFNLLVQASNNADDLATFFNNAPEFIGEMLSLLGYEDEIPEDIRILGIQSLVALHQDRSYQPMVLSSVSAGGHRGTLPSLMQKAVDSVTSGSMRFSIVFAEALLSLISILVSSTPGSLALQEGGFIPSILPLLKDTNAQHLHLVSTAVRVIEGFLDYHNPSLALFRDLGGLDNAIARLKVEVTHVERGANDTGEKLLQDSKGKQIISSLSELERQSFSSESMVTHDRRSLIKALLRTISLATYVPGSSTRVDGSEESLLPTCLSIIFRRAKEFGGGVFSLAANVMSDIIHKDPTCFSVLAAADVPGAFLDAIDSGVPCSSEAVSCIPQCLDALCLNNTGLQLVKNCNALRCLIKIFTSASYLRALNDQSLEVLSNGLDELMRHSSLLRASGVDVLIEILNTILRYGSCSESYSTESECSSVRLPVEINLERDSISLGKGEMSVTGNSEQLNETSFDGTSLISGSFLPEYIGNASRLLEAVLQNANTINIFIERRGIEALLKLFTVQVVPTSDSVSQSISNAFKKFSSQNSATLTRAICSFIKEHLKFTNELLSSVSGTKVVEIEHLKQTEVLKCLSSLMGLLSLSTNLLKGSSTMNSELGSADADILKELAKAYKEVIWQISLCSDSSDGQRAANQEIGNVDASASASDITGRDGDDDGNTVPVVQYMNTVSIRNSFASRWRTERDLSSIPHSSGTLHRHARHSLSRARGGRIYRQLDPSHTDSEGSASTLENYHIQDVKSKSADFVVPELLRKLGLAIRSFLVTIVKGLSARRGDSSSLSLFSKNLVTAVAKLFLDALSYPGHSTPGLELTLSVKCRYLGKVVEDIVAIIVDKRRTCSTALVNSFYVNGTFKELLTTFEATSQLLWTLPFSILAATTDQGSFSVEKVSHRSWLLDTLQTYCCLLAYHVNSSLLLSSASSSDIQLLVQPVAAGLSIGLFPVPRDPELFVRMLQSQVLDVILPIWNHPMFPNCSPSFITSVNSILTYIYLGVGHVKHGRNDIIGSTSRRFTSPSLDESAISTIVEMGFSRARAEEALRSVGANSVEMAMDWLFSHPEEIVQEDVQLAQALALSLGNTFESSKEDNNEMTINAYLENKQEAPPVDDVLALSVKLLHCGDVMVFSLTDLFLALCRRNNSEDRRRVVLFLVQQLKFCPSDFSDDTGALCPISHILSLLLHEDSSTRESAAENGLILVVLDILSKFKSRNESRYGTAATKAVSSLLLVVDNMAQSRPKFISGAADGAGKSLSDLSGAGMSFANSTAITDKESAVDDCEKESSDIFEKILGKSTGFLTLEESQRALSIACEFIKQHVPAMVMQAVLQLSARLTKTHALASQFLESGGLAALFGLPKSCVFPGFDSLVSVIVRHLIEDAQTLQTAMELEMKQTLVGTHSRHAGRLSPKLFLTSMAPLISRDPVVFMRAAATICHIESSGGRINIVLRKEKEKDKDKLRTAGNEGGFPSTESIRLPENRLHDTPSKCSRSHKRVPGNLSQVIDQLLEIILSLPSLKKEEEGTSSSVPMEIDEHVVKEKGKSKIGEIIMMDKDNLSERSAWLSKVTFVLKLLTDILLMYTHAVGVLLRRDVEIFQMQDCGQLGVSGHSAILHHILHHLLPLSSERSSETSDELNDKLSEKASWFLVVLCGKSTEGRRRVISEILRALLSFLDEGPNTSKSLLIPDKQLLTFVELINSILSRNSSSSNLPGPGCSPDIAKAMIDGGMARSLSCILQVIDLDHPNAPKVVNLIVKALENLTRAANADQVVKLDGLAKKRSTLPRGRTGDHPNAGTENANNDQNENYEATAASQHADQLHPESSHDEMNHDVNQDSRMEQNTRVNVEENQTINPHDGLEFMHEEMEEVGGTPNTNEIGLTFQDDHQNIDDMGYEDEDVGEDIEDDDEDDDQDDEEDVAEDGAALSLADTDMEDHDDNDNGIGDEYNDHMIDGEDGHFPDNPVIEVRWRESLTGLDHLRVLRGPVTASAFIDIAEDPFQGLDSADLYHLHRPFGLDHSRQGSNRTSELSRLDATAFRHPLLMRPSHSVELSTSLWSTNGSSSRDLNSSFAGLGSSPLNIFDATVPSEHAAGAAIFGDRLDGAAHPHLIDFSRGMDFSHITSRRGPGDNRWTDDGQPQAGGHASAIAQAVEDQFLAHLRAAISVDNPQAMGKSECANQVNRQPQLLDVNVQALETTNLDTLSTENQQQDSGIISDHQLVNLPLEGYSCPPDSSHEIVVQQVAIAEDSRETTEIRQSIPYNLNITNNNNSETIASMVAVFEVDLSTTALPVMHPVQNATEILTDSHDPEFHNECEPVHSSLGSPSGGQGLISSGSGMQELSDAYAGSAPGSADVHINGINAVQNQYDDALPSNGGVSVCRNIEVPEQATQANRINSSNEASSTNAIDPTFLEALPVDLRAEVLASQQASQPTQATLAATYAPPPTEEIDPEFLAALPPDIQAEVLAQQQVQRNAQFQQAEGQPVEMDNASIIATFPPELREEVLLTSPEAVLSRLPPALIAEAQMLRDRRNNSRYHYRSTLFGGSHRLDGRRLAANRQTVMDRGVGVTIGRRVLSPNPNTSKVKEVEGTPLLDADAMKALIRLLRLAQPISKGLLQRLLLNLCAHTVTRNILVSHLVDMIRLEADGPGQSIASTSQRLYGCRWDVVYGRPHHSNGLPPFVTRRLLEILTYLAKNNLSVASVLFYFDPSSAVESTLVEYSENKREKGKEKTVVTNTLLDTMETSAKGFSPLILLLKLLDRPLFLRSNVHLEQVMCLLQVVVNNAVSEIDCEPHFGQAPGCSEREAAALTSSDSKHDNLTSEQNPGLEMNPKPSAEASSLSLKSSVNRHDIFLQLPKSDMRNLCHILAHEGLSDKVYSLTAELVKKIALVAIPHRNFFAVELADLANLLSSSAITELLILRNSKVLGLGTGSMAGAPVLRVLQALSVLASVDCNKDVNADEQQSILWNLNKSLEPLWQALSDCISATETQIGQTSSFSFTVPVHDSGVMAGPFSPAQPLPPPAQRLLPYIEAFFLLCEKLQTNQIIGQPDSNVTAREVKESAGSSSSPIHKCTGMGTMTFARIAEKHRRLLNVFIRQNPNLLEKSLSMMLKLPRLIDFDNKRAYFRSRIRQQHDQHFAVPLRISVRRAYVLEDSYNQLRLRSSQDLKGRLTVQFQGEEGIDAGGLTREWYQLLSRVTFDKGALLFTTVGNNSTFQPNPNSAYQTEHLSYFRFVGRLVAKALFDGQLLDVYFTRSFYKHILGVKVTYHDIEAVDPDYYKNLKWMLENDVSDIPDLTFSIDADEEKHILYGKNQVTDYELIPGGRNIRVTEETKHEYVDLVAEHILTTAIRPQINSFLEGFNELVPRELVSIFNDKELELLLSGLPEIDIDDLQANTEYTGYSAASIVIQWFWEVVKSFNKEDMARLLQFVTGTSKVPLEGFKALQGISGPQRFQIHKAYGTPKRLPSAHTCFNQLDLPEYSSREQLEERLLLAIHEASEGFGFG